jgi:hypothetical protein
MKFIVQSAEDCFYKNYEEDILEVKRLEKIGFTFEESEHSFVLSGPFLENSAGCRWPYTCLDIETIEALVNFQNEFGLLLIEKNDSPDFGGHITICNDRGLDSRSY